MAEEGGSPPGRRHPPAALRRWLAAATFVLGLFTGGIVVGLLGVGSTPPAERGAPARATGVDVGGGAIPTSGRAVVDAACLRALNGAQDVYGEVDDLGTAAGALDAARLDEVVRRLQPLQPLQARLGENLGTCHVTPVSTSGSPTAAVPPSSSGAPPS